MRGNPDRDCPGRPGRGSIPACAGEPSCRLPGARTRSVYPRVCGGTPPTRTTRWTAGGLSPRVRGNHILQRYAFPPEWSIPACAGEPLHKAGCTNHYRVYPRVCGGTSCLVAGALAAAGLSPRVRGNHRWGGGPRQQRGSIPACAGEPDAPGLLGSGSRVYPRVCGGTCGCRLSAAR